MINIDLLFYLCSTGLIACSFMVVVAQHPVFSLLFLVGCFIFSAFLLLLLELEFLALLFIVIYVGAIAILFLFAVMMLEFKLENLSKNSIKYIPISIFFGLVLLSFFFKDTLVFFSSNFYFENFYLNNSYQNWYDLIDATTDVETCGHILYSYFVLQFLLTGLILLLVLVGVVYLTNTFVSIHSTDQSIFKQLSRKTNF